MQQQKATVDLDRLQKRFDAIDSRPDGVIEVDAQGRGSCRLHLENLGTDELRGAQIFVAAHAFITGPPGVLLSKVPRGPKPHLSFNDASLGIGPFGTLSIGTNGQAMVSPWFALKVRPTVQKIALLIRATAQNAPAVQIYPTISVTPRLQSLATGPDDLQIVHAKRRVKTAQRGLVSSPGARLDQHPGVLTSHGSGAMKVSCRPSW
jgi:hypothetical protein